MIYFVNSRKGFLFYYFISFASILCGWKPSLVGLGRPEVKPVEQALVDDRSLNGLPKKPSCDEAGSSTEKGWAVRWDRVIVNLPASQRLRIAKI